MLTLLSILIAAAGMRSIALVLLAVLLIDIAIQTVNVFSQTRLFSIDPASRSRLNTAFVVANFLGGSIGSALAGVLWQAGGWLMITIGEAAIILIALAAWTFGRATLKAAHPQPAAGMAS